MIHSKIWNEIIGWMLFRLLKVLSSPFLTKLFFSIGNMLLSGDDFFIFTKVWDKVVSWNFFCRLFSYQFVTMLFFSFNQVEISHLNVMIDTKIWNEIVSWRSNWLVESCLEFFTHF